MSFDVNGNFVRPGSFASDKANDRDLTDVRLDTEFNEVATALTQLKNDVENVSSTGTASIGIDNVTGLTAALAGKQAALGYIPVNINQIGVSLAPLNTSTGKIDATYLPSSSGGSSAAGVSSFNGRDGVVALQSSDVVAAMGYTPAPDVHTHTEDQIVGLTAALAAKQAALGFTPANAVHEHFIADVTGLQAALDDKMEVSTATASGETSFPIGQYLIVQCGSITKNGSVAIYTGVTGTDAYTTTSAGSPLDGTWRVRGPLATTPSFALFQRTA